MSGIKLRAAELGSGRRDVERIGQVVSAGAAFFRDLTWRRAAVGLLVVFIAECTVGSSGRLVSFGPVSIRMVIFVSCLLVGLPAVWAQRTYLRSLRFVWLVLGFVVMVLIWAAYGLARGNAQGFIANDVTSFLTVLLIPVALALRMQPREVRRLLSTLFWSAVALATVTTAIHFLAPFGLDVNGVNRWLNARSQGGLADVGGMLRIYLRSHIMLVPALVIGLTRLAEGDAYRRRYLAGTSLIVLGLMLSLTRSLWIGAVCTLLLLAVWLRGRSLPLFRQMLPVLGVLGVLLVLSSVVYRGPLLVRAAAERLSPSLVVVIPGAQSPRPTTSVPSSTPPSHSGPTSTVRPSPTVSSTLAPVVEVEDLIDERNAAAVRIRDLSLALHKTKIAERPLVGWGLGYNLDSVRHDGRTEYMYWDLLMKLGALGFAVFSALYLGVFFALRGAPRPQRLGSDPRVVAACICAPAVASYFNPFLNSPLGLSVLLVAVVAAYTNAAGMDLDGAVAGDQRPSSQAMADSRADDRRPHRYQGRHRR